MLSYWSQKKNKKYIMIAWVKTRTGNACDPRMKKILFEINR